MRVVRNVRDEQEEISSSNSSNECEWRRRGWDSKHMRRSQRAFALARVTAIGLGACSRELDGVRDMVDATAMSDVDGGGVTNIVRLGITPSPSQEKEPELKNLLMKLKTTSSSTTGSPCTTLLSPESHVPSLLFKDPMWHHGGDPCVTGYSPNWTTRTLTTNSLPNSMPNSLIQGKPRGLATN